MDGAELTVEGGLIVAPQIAGLPAVEPAGFPVGQCGVGERGDESPQRGLRVVAAASSANAVQSTNCWPKLSTASRNSSYLLE